MMVFKLLLVIVALCMGSVWGEGIETVADRIMKKIGDRFFWYILYINNLSFTILASAFEKSVIRGK